MATQFDVKRWHRRRRMFAIWNDTLLIAPAQVTYSHEEWFRALMQHPDQVEAMMTAAPRGYVPWYHDDGDG